VLLGLAAAALFAATAVRAVLVLRAGGGQDIRYEVTCRIYVKDKLVAESVNTAGVSCEANLP
jgi:hypothetical protein